MHLLRGLVKPCSNSKKSSYAIVCFLLNMHRYHLIAEDGSGAEEPLITHSRHRAHLENAVEFLGAFLHTRTFLSVNA